MAKSVFSYYARGHKIARKYAKKGSGNRIISSLYQLVHVLSIPTFFLTPLFATSSYGFHYMLDRAEDAVIEKSFDGTEHGKSYIAGLIASLVCVLFAGLIIGIGFIASMLVNQVIDKSIGERNHAEAQLFSLVATIVIFLIAGIFALICMLVLQSALFVSAKNKALGPGDVLYNALNFVRNNGFKLVILDFFQILTILLPFGLLIGGGVALGILSAASYQFFKPLFLVLSYVLYLLAVVFGVFFFGQLATAFFYSVYLFLNDEADTTKYVVVYPKPDAEIKNGKKKGKFIEIVSVQENPELHPLEPISGDPEELK